MSVYIHYQGTSAEPKKIPELLDKLESLSQVFGWTATRVDRELSGLAPKKIDIGDGPTRITGVRLLEDRVTGISFDMGEAGPFSILFNKKGVLQNYMEVSDLVKGAETNGEKCWCPLGLWACVTGFPEAHKNVCIMLLYMKTLHRFRKWDVYDTTGYYESGDEKQLRREHALHGAFKDMMSDPVNAKAFMVATGICSEDDEVVAVDPVLRQPKMVKAARAGRPN